MIYASSSEHDVIYGQPGDSIGHVRSAGDVDAGKAWRAVRRPSDMVRLAA